MGMLGLLFSQITLLYHVCSMCDVWSQEYCKSTETIGHLASLYEIIQQSSYIYFFSPVDLYGMQILSREDSER